MLLLWDGYDFIMLKGEQFTELFNLQKNCIRISILSLRKKLEVSYYVIYIMISGINVYKKRKNEMVPAYERFLSTEFEALLKGPLKFLTQTYDRLFPSNLCEPELELKNTYALDLQLRPMNKIIFYHGGTCILTVSYCLYNNSLEFNAGAYTQRDGCCEKAETLKNENNLSNIEKMEKAFTDYLKAAVKSVNRKYSGKGTEGYWEQRLSCLWGGRVWNEHMDFLIIDRQAVLSFANKNDKQAYYSPLKDKYTGISHNLYEKYKTDPDSKDWKELTGIGDELDLLAIGPNKELVCIELKTGKIDKAFYYAPLQAACYGEAFKKAFPSISADIKSLVKQKVRLGLLPKESIKRLPDEDFNVKSLLLVLDASELSLKSKVWERLSEVMLNIDKVNRPSVLMIP